MTKLSQSEHDALMADMKQYDEPMPSVGIFWYDPEEHCFFGVRKKELTPKMVEDAADKGLPCRTLSSITMSTGISVTDGPGICKS